MLILGIDPGTATTGFGLLERNGKELTALDYGLIETSKDALPEARLAIIYAKLILLIEKYKPDVLVIEAIFFATNAKTAIKVGQAQGVMLLSAAHKQIPVAVYAPMTIKKMVTGSGRSDKKEMQIHVRKILGARIKSKAKQKTHFDNAADALAVALCHAFKIEL